MWPNNSTPRYIPKWTENENLHKKLYMNIHSSIVQSSPKVETIHLPTNWRVEKQIKIIVAYYGMRRKDIYYNMYELWKHNSQWKQPDAKDYILWLYCMISFIWHIQNEQIQRGRKQISGFQGLVWGAMVSDC